MALVLSGCRRPASGVSAPEPSNNAATAATAAHERPPHLDHAQPRLPTLKLWLGDQELDTEVARAPLELQTGMMFRTNMAENEGMLFVFGRGHRAAFYMRNTRVPLSAAYIDPEGAILELHDLKPLDETPVEAASDRIQFVLETPQGWFQRHNVAVGAVIRTPYGALREVNWATLKRARAR